MLPGRLERQNINSSQRRYSNVSKPGLPATVKMRHDLHYVEELSRGNRPIGKVIDLDRIEPNPEQPRTEFGDLDGTFGIH